MNLRIHLVLLMVDLATHFCATQLLRSKSAAEVWGSIQKRWSLVYMVPPDIIYVDQSTNFVSAETTSHCRSAEDILIEAPIETPGSIGTVELYQAPLRLSFERIGMYLGTETSEGESSKMEGFSVN